MNKLVVHLLITGVLAFTLAGCTTETSTTVTLSKPPSPQISSLIDSAHRMDCTAANQFLLESVSSARDVVDVLALSNAVLYDEHYYKDRILLQGVSLATTTQEVLWLASYCNNNAVRDQIVSLGLPTVHTIDDLVKLASASSSYLQRDKMLRDGLSMATSVDDVIKLASNCGLRTDGDAILLEGTKFAKTDADFEKLAKKAFDGYTKQKIRERAANIQPIEPTSPPVCDALNQAYEDMQAAYQVYTLALNTKADPVLIKQLAADYNKKKGIYESMLKN